jgi:hypothetical protein
MIPCCATNLIFELHAANAQQLYIKIVYPGGHVMRRANWMSQR